MTAVATLRDAWNAETTTPPVLETLTAAAIAKVAVGVTADCARHEALYGFKDCLLLRGFQADLSRSCEDFAFGIGLAALRSPMGRG